MQLSLSVLLQTWIFKFPPKRKVIHSFPTWIGELHLVYALFMFVKKRDNNKNKRAYWCILFCKSAENMGNFIDSLRSVET